MLLRSHYARPHTKFLTVPCAIRNRMPPRHRESRGPAGPPDPSGRGDDERMVHGAGGATYSAMCGVSLMTAVTLSSRTATYAASTIPRQLMTCLGLVPSEASTGERVRRGGITKAGNSRARRVLVEAAWTCLPARMSRLIQERPLRPLSQTHRGRNAQGRDLARGRPSCRSSARRSPQPRAPDSPIERGSARRNTSKHSAADACAKPQAGPRWGILG